MPRFGAHLSIAGGVDRAVDRAALLRCECLQLFVKSPSQWRFAALQDATVERFRASAARAGLRPLVGHASYLVNLASPDPSLWERSRRCVLQEWDRAARLGLDYLVLHPGAHMGSGAPAGIQRIARALDWLHRQRFDRLTRILLETTAGAGTVLGGTLEELRAILAASACADRLGVALDTCHLFAAGYDLRTPEALHATLGRLDAAVGLERVAVVHANDSKGGLGSGLDRHEHIGRGQIGREGFRLLVNHPALEALPFILETPKEDARGRKMDPANLRALRRLVTPS
jgi:deoxyribonuclease-4